MFVFVRGSDVVGAGDGGGGVGSDPSASFCSRSLRHCVWDALSASERDEETEQTRVIPIFC